METKTPSLSRAFEAAPRSTFGTKVNIWSLGPFLGGVPSNQAEERRCVVKVDFDPPVIRDTITCRMDSTDLLWDWAQP